MPAQKSATSNPPTRHSRHGRSGSASNCATSASADAPMNSAPEAATQADAGKYRSVIIVHLDPIPPVATSLPTVDEEVGADPTGCHQPST